jgi:hypothetical protein
MIPWFRDILIGEITHRIIGFMMSECVHPTTRYLGFRGLLVEVCAWGIHVVYEVFCGELRDTKYMLIQESRSAAEVHGVDEL